MPNNEVLKYNSDGKVTSVHNPVNGTSVSDIGYTYDDNGNILTISENGTQKVSYTYNSDSELTRENNVWQNQSIVYIYDANRNMLTKTVYPYTAANLTSVTPTHTYNYQYGNSSDPDQLTSYDGKAITYDTNGNMLTYNGWSYTWQNKQLATAGNSTSNISYQYNAAGIRTSKTINGITTNYTVDDSNNIISETNGTDTIHYTYDSNGKLQFMTINGTKYAYETNAQGDVTGLVDSSNNEVVTYAYDSWGKLLRIGGSLANTVGAENHMCYRGYYYDTETGLYYLQSRYYNPELERFISKDDTSYHVGQTGAAANLYVYGNNNPVMSYDPTGHINWWLLGHGVWLVCSGIWNIFRAIRLGLVASATSTWTARVVGWLCSLSMASSALQQYYMLIVYVASIVITLRYAVRLLYTVPKGLNEIRRAFY